MFTARWTLGISFCRGKAMSHSLRLRVLSLGSLLFRLMLPFVRVLLLLWHQSSSDVFLGCLLLCLMHQPLLVPPTSLCSTASLSFFSDPDISQSSPSPFLSYYYYFILFLSLMLLLMMIIKNKNDEILTFLWAQTY